MKDFASLEDVLLRLGNKSCSLTLPTGSLMLLGLNQDENVFLWRRFFQSCRFELFLHSDRVEY